MTPDILDRNCPKHGVPLMQRHVGGGKLAVVCPTCESAVLAAFVSPAGTEAHARNIRVSARWDELTRLGKHGHYETLFQVVREEVERSTSAANK